MTFEITYHIGFYIFFYLVGHYFGYNKCKKDQVSPLWNKINECFKLLRENKVMDGKQFYDIIRK